jgi:hypothetical protein
MFCERKYPSGRYRYQLEAFVDQVRGRKPQAWVMAQDSIDNLEWLEKVYNEVCSAEASR